MTMYPTIEPFDHDMLDVGDRNLIYWEICGNPQGKPALVLHGGPGSGCTPGMRRFFDPAAYGSSCLTSGDAVEVFRMRATMRWILRPTQLTI